jgi:arsenate reductase (glutaredoxin)
MSEFQIYHNPRCSKSRAALALLEAHGVTPQVIEYLSETPSAAALREVVRKLGIEPAELVRKGEEIYRKKYAGRTLSDAEWIDAMVKDPILIERPIVIRGERAMIGRPPENVQRLFA